jgi:hypothetical protein
LQFVPINFQRKTLRMRPVQTRLLVHTLLSILTLCLGQACSSSSDAPASPTPGEAGAAGSTTADASTAGTGGSSGSAGSAAAGGFSGAAGSAAAGGSSGSAGSGGAPISHGRGRIASGWNHNCSLTTAGSARCWGMDSVGQLGDNGDTDSSVAVQVTGLSSGVAALASTMDFTCALTASGAVRCWGKGLSGQLGNGQEDDSPVPVEVAGLTSPAVSIASGANHACVVLDTGAVRCWGDNNNGQLGDGSNVASLHPVDVTGFGSGGVAVAGGGLHTCAVTSSGSVRCWGDNTFGQLGNASTTDSLIPVDVQGLSSGAVVVTTGDFHSCALTSAGAVRCWGDNDFGQIGATGTQYSLTPVDVPGLGSGVIALEAGYKHTCAVLDSGAVRCWGSNEDGQLGNPSPNATFTPTEVTGISSGAISVTTGYHHSCALLASGGARCWGDNEWGQLGNGTNKNSTVPVDVKGL